MSSPLDFLDARLSAAVAAVTGDVADPLRGLYISDEQAVELTGKPRDRRCDPRLSEAIERLGLDPMDARVLCVCAAPELDPRYGQLYAYLQDDVTRRLPTARLVAALLDEPRVHQRLVYGAGLVGSGAVRVLDGDLTLPLADRPIKLAEPLAAFLLGVAPTMAGVRRVQPASGGARGAEIEEIALALDADTSLPLVICGPDRRARVAAAAGRPLLILDLHDLGRIGDVIVASALENSLLCFEGFEELSPAERVHALDLLPPRPVLLASSAAAVSALRDRLARVIELPLPSFAERRGAWEDLAGVRDAREVAAKFRLSIEQITDAAEIAGVAARARDLDAPDPSDLELGARHVSSSGLGELAARLTPAYRWDDLVLAERPRDMLRGVAAYLRHRDQVLSEWGYERTVSRTQGLKVLFAGESGTGKTMASQVLAAELGLDLYRVDLSTVVSKYIGETEKNLERIFTAADGSNAILFFDEADALFGKRSEVSDSHDRYSNLEVAYLLQRIEVYPGVVILATNFKRNIDDAFVRRLDFVVDFPFPDPDDRRRIWQSVLPEEAPLAGDVDLDFLARQFKLSGGAIRNCSLAAAFRAADEGEAIAMRHLVRAVAQEYAKQGRLTLEADFARFHGMVRSDAALSAA